jgi:hypothetical protein
MPDLADLQEALEGLRRDRHQLAKLAHQLEVSSGHLLVQGAGGDQVLDMERLVYVQAREGRIHFVLADGRDVAGNTTYTMDKATAQLANYPNVVRTQDDYMVNLAYVRGVGPAPKGKLLYMAAGPTTLPLATRFEKTLERFFHLPTLVHAVPWNDRYQALIDENIRDFEQDLRLLPVEDLKREFKYQTLDKVNVRELMGNLIWQYRCWMDLPEGDRRRKVPVDGNIRTFWYYIKPVLSRLGILDPDHQYETMLAVFKRCVSDHRLFHYRDFGFADEGASRRQVGKTYPHIILVAEKDGHYSRLLKFQEEFGCSIISLGGQPSVLTGEFFCAELAKVVDFKQTAIRVIAMVDYDFSGDIIIGAFHDRLWDFGVKHQTRADVVLSERFYPEELPGVIYTLPLNTKGDRTKAKKWLAKGGGIDGQLMGIESEALIFTGRLHETVAKLIEEAKQPPPPEALLAPGDALSGWELPPTFSAELLAPDEAGFWEHWADAVEAHAARTG